MSDYYNAFIPVRPTNINLDNILIDGGGFCINKPKTQDNRQIILHPDFETQHTVVPHKDWFSRFHKPYVKISRPMKPTSRKSFKFEPVINNPGFENDDEDYHGGTLLYHQYLNLYSGGGGDKNKKKLQPIYEQPEEYDNPYIMRRSLPSPPYSPQYSLDIAYASSKQPKCKKQTYKPDIGSMEYIANQLDNRY